MDLLASVLDRCVCYDSFQYLAFTSEGIGEQSCMVLDAYSSRSPSSALRWMDAEKNTINHLFSVVSTGYCSIRVSFGQNYREKCFLLFLKISIIQPRTCASFQKHALRMDLN